MGRKEKGFTMIELMVAISIMAVVITIAIPVYNAQVPRMRLNGAARKMMGDFMSAKMNAVKLNTAMNVAFSSTGYTISGGSYSETYNMQSHYPGITVSSASDFAFSSRGTTNDGASYTVTLTNSEGSTKQVAINVAGQIKIN